MAERLNSKRDTHENALWREIDATAASMNSTLCKIVQVWDGDMLQNENLPQRVKDMHAARPEAWIALVRTEWDQHYLYFKQLPDEIEQLYGGAVNLLESAGKIEFIGNSVRSGALALTAKAGDAATSGAKAMRILNPFTLLN